MSERENILKRIREALRLPAPRPGFLHATRPLSPEGVHENAPAAAPAPGIRSWLPLVGPTPEQWEAAFAEQSLDLKTEFRPVNGIDEAASALAEIARTESWTRVGTHSGALTDAAVPRLHLPILATDRPYEATDLDQCQVGITECDALIAQTGTVLITARSAGGRALSVLPPHHIVLARRDQLVPDLPAAFELLERKYAPDYPSFISFITGPSRTGDIERILVLGAHGPKRLTVFCV